MVTVTTKMQCAYTTCHRLLETSDIINDTTLSFGILVMMYFDAIFHIHCIYVETMKTTGLFRPLSPNEYLPPLLRDFHYPARLYMSFFCKHLLGNHSLYY
uniref:Uncharacterized protein n=1 Tax=Paramoeba aestuarina TaxID=180227 RepID=A0A7S4K4L0_9EUKA